jgi:hypothetical protein
MNKEVAVLLGGNKLNRGVLDEFRHRGLEVFVMDWNSDSALKGDRNLQVDVKDSTRVLEALKNLGRLDVRVAYTSIDAAVPTVVAIHRHYGLKVPQGWQYESPLSKAQMTTAWQRDGLLNRLSWLAPSGQDALPPIAGDRQMIVKPNLSSNSRGITILPANADCADYMEALQRARQASFDGQAIVEEFFHGREFTVEMLGDGFGNVSVYVISVQYHSEHAGPNKVANKLHYNSAAFPDEAYERIAEYGRRCYRSLGLHLSFGHLEILMREDGLLSPVEIGARSGGFIASPLTKIASGRDFLGDYMEVLEGARVNGDGAFYKSSMSSMYFFYDFPPGRPCRHATNLPEHLPPGIKSCYSDHEAIAAGRAYQTIDDGGKRFGHEILYGRRDLLTIEAIESAERRMLEAMFGEEIE